MRQWNHWHSKCVGRDAVTIQSGGEHLYFHKTWSYVADNWLLKKKHRRSDMSRCQRATCAHPVDKHRIHVSGIQSHSIAFINASLTQSSWLTVDSISRYRQINENKYQLNVKSVPKREWRYWWYEIKIFPGAIMSISMSMLAMLCPVSRSDCLGC